MAGHFTDERHALFAGWVLGLAWRNGIAAEPVMDDDGNYTDRLEVRLPFRPDAGTDGGLRWYSVTLIVPPPPDDWHPFTDD